MRPFAPEQEQRDCAGIAEPPGSSILDLTTAQFRDLLDEATAQASLDPPPASYLAPIYL
jgi:hypothetical protein